MTPSSPPRAGRVERAGRASATRRWQRPLGEVEHEDQDAEAPPQHAADVGGADVAAALLEDVDALERATR